MYRVLHDLYQIRLLKSKLSAEQLDLRAVLTNAIQVKQMLSYNVVIIIIIMIISLC